MTDKDIQVREKQEVQTQAETTRNIPVYIPAVDILETEEALTLVADMPGVSPENVDIDIRDDQLTIRGTDHSRHGHLGRRRGNGAASGIRCWGLLSAVHFRPHHRSIQNRSVYEKRCLDIDAAKGG